MGFKEFMCIVFIAAGTYLLRYLPLKAGIKRRAGKKEESNPISEILEISGISIIASLLVSSIDLPGGEADYYYILNITVSSLIVVGSCLLWRNPGVGVISGIFSFALIGFLIS